MAKKKTKVKPLKLTKEQKKELREREIYQSLIRNQAKRINEGYKVLEAANLEDRSQSYKTVEHYAVSDPIGKGKHFSMDYATGNVRVSGDTRKMTLKEMKEYSETLAQILKHKTRTVSGVKKAMKKSYEEAKKTYNFEGSQEQYEKVWETYKNNVEPDKRQKLDSELVMAVLEYSDIYKMSSEDIDAAFAYLNRADDLDEALEGISDIQNAIEIFEQYTPEEAAKEIKKRHYEEFVEMFPNKFSIIKEFM